MYTSILLNIIKITDRVGKRSPRRDTNFSVHALISTPYSTRSKCFFFPKERTKQLVLSVLHRNFVSVCIPLSFPKQQMQENHMHDLKRAPVLEVHHSCNEEKERGEGKCWMTVCIAVC